MEPTTKFSFLRTVETRTESLEKYTPGLDNETGLSVVYFETQT